MFRARSDPTRVFPLQMTLALFIPTYHFPECRADDAKDRVGPHVLSLGNEAIPSRSNTAEPTLSRPSPSVSYLLALAWTRPTLYSFPPIVSSVSLSSGYSSIYTVWRPEILKKQTFLNGGMPEWFKGVALRFRNSRGIALTSDIHWFAAWVRTPLPSELGFTFLPC